MDINKSCCFIGHRKIRKTPELKNALIKIIENLITEKNIDTFLLGSKSQFNNFCKTALDELKEKYPHINRIYVRAEFQYINDDYMSYLMELYDYTYFPEQIAGAGKATYIKRNYEMIDKSCYCIFFYDENYTPARRKNCKKDSTEYQPKSGTATAYDYAVKKGKQIINLNT